MTKNDNRQQNKNYPQKPHRETEEAKGFGNKKTEGPDRPAT